MHSSCARNLDAWLPAQGRQPPRLDAPRRRIPDERFAQLRFPPGLSAPNRSEAYYRKVADHLIEQVESGTTRWRPLTVPPIVHVQPARLQHVLLVAPAERFILAM